MRLPFLMIKILMIKIFFIGMLYGLPQTVSAFNFADYEHEEAQQEADQRAAKRDKIARLTAVPCRAQLKGKKVALLIGEEHNGRISSKASKYGLMFQELNKRLRQLGLNTYTQEEIKAQIAQAELEAVLSNDPDAALAASQKMGASFIIRGIVSSRSQVNPILKINEVFVNIGLTLLQANGRTVSDVTAQGDSYAGGDIVGAALAIVREQADGAVAQLYHDYCTTLR